MKKKEKTQPELSPERLAELKAKMAESLSIDRHHLLVKFPFMGNLLLRMDLVPVRDKRNRTACTDGAKIYFDIAFYNKLSPQDRRFVLAHELGHCVLLHLGRCQTRIQKIYNIASDMEVNYMLQQQSSGGDLDCPPTLMFPPKSMQGKSAEVIYEWLIRKMKQQKKNGEQMKIPNGNPKDLRGDRNNGYGWNQGDKERDDADEGDTKRSPEKDGKDEGSLDGQFDNHKFADDEDKPDNPADGSGEGENEGDTVTDEYGEVGYDPDYKPRVSKDFADRMREAVIAEAQRCQRTQGHLPAGLEGILNNLPKPEINWREELCQFVTSCHADRRSYLPPQRRHVYNEMYFQSRRGEKLKVAAIVDTSGSVWGDLSKFFAELNSLLKTFTNYELTVVQCDAAVQDVHTYNEEDPFPIDNPGAIEVNGCGGSDFTPAFKHIRENGIEDSVDCIVVITDGFIDFPKYPPEKPVLIVLTKDGNTECCDWGRKIVFKEHTVDSDF